MQRAVLTVAGEQAGATSVNGSVVLAVAGEALERDGARRVFDEPDVADLARAPRCSAGRRRSRSPRRPAPTRAAQGGTRSKPRAAGPSASRLADARVAQEQFVPGAQHPAQREARRVGEARAAQTIEVSASSPVISGVSVRNSSSTSPSARKPWKSVGPPSLSSARMPRARRSASAAAGVHSSSRTTSTGAATGGGSPASREPVDDHGLVGGREQAGLPRDVEAARDQHRGRRRAGAPLGATSRP